MIYYSNSFKENISILDKLDILTQNQKFDIFDDFGWIHPATYYSYAAMYGMLTLTGKFGNIIPDLSVYEKQYAEKIGDLETYCKQWNTFNFFDKVYLLTYLSDSALGSDDFKRIISYIPEQTEMRTMFKFLSSMSKLSRNIKLVVDTKEETPIYELPIEKQVEIAISLCIGDMYHNMNVFYNSIKRGETRWLDFWDLLKVTSCCILQHESFDVVDKMVKWVTSKQRAKKIDEIFE